MKGVLLGIGFRRDLVRLDNLLKDLSDRPECIPLFLAAQSEKTKLAKVFVYALGMSSQVIEVSEYQDKINAMLSLLMPYVPTSDRQRIGEQLSKIDKGDYSTAIAKTRTH
jgi:hypothetical protein